MRCALSAHRRLIQRYWSPDMVCSSTTAALLIGVILLAAAAGAGLGLLHLRNRKD